MSSADQRVAPRVPFEVEVTIHSENNFFTGMTSNLSEGGVFIATLAPPPVGTELGFQLILGGERFMVLGVVTWIRGEHSAAQGVPAGCGVRWLNLEDGALEAIQRFVEVRETEFHEDD